VRAVIDEPGTPAFPAPAKLPRPIPLAPVAAHAGLLAAAGEVVGKTVGIVGTAEIAPTVPTMGNSLGTGTGGVELTPRLPISKDPNGIPVRAPPPGTVGDVEIGVEIGMDDEAMLLEPEPHIPDIPDVSSVPDDIGISDVTEVADEIDVPEFTVVPEFAAVAGAPLPDAVPPPS
jgi:hypothetical protein